MEDESPLYKKFSEKEILELCGVQKDVYRIKEEIHLPAAKENIGSLLLGESALRKLDTRLEEGGLVLRGELQIFCLYESQNMKTEWVEQSVPFEGRLSLRRDGGGDVPLRVRRPGGGQHRGQAGRGRGGAHLRGGGVPWRCAAASTGRRRSGSWRICTRRGGG